MFTYFLHRHATPVAYSFKKNRMIHKSKNLARNSQRQPNTRMEFTDSPRIPRKTLGFPLTNELRKNSATIKK